jgi:archaellum component FlaC
MKLPKKLSNQVKKKKLTGENNDLKTEIRHLGVIVEHTDDKVSLLAEQYGDIKKDIGGIKDTLNSHTEMIGRLNIDVTIIKEDVEFIKSSLKKKIDIEEFAALERRVTLLEKRR